MYASPRPTRHLSPVISNVEQEARWGLYLSNLVVQSGEDEATLKREGNMRTPQIRYAI